MESGAIVTSVATCRRCPKSDELTWVNDYRLGRLLGTGAYGSVYRCRRDRQEFAIKVQKGRVSGAFGGRHGSEAGTSAQAQREASIMRLLGHRNVTKLFEIIDEPGHDEVYLVMELVEGTDLGEPVRRRQAVPDSELRAWMRDIVLGLEHLHLHGVCHRDLKPENMLRDSRSGLVKLADFGASLLVSVGKRLGGDFITASGGTPAFFAPEMCRTGAISQGGYSGRAADLWALGVSMYLWVFHAPPYIAPTAPLLMELIRAEEVSYDGDSHGAGELVMSLMRGLLARSPSARHSLADLRRDPLLTLAGHEPLPPAEVPESLGSLAKMAVETAFARVSTLHHAVRPSPR